MMSAEISGKLPYPEGEVDVTVKLINSSGKKADFEFLPANTVSLDISKMVELMNNQGCKVELSTANLLNCAYKKITVTLFASGKIVIEGLKSQKPDDALKLVRELLSS